ncbi:MAG: hypothetical protein L3J91_00295 [Thermoplasmata archaeon]|nr:hypothetical protein [Thermoplasmata archaeon]
MLLILIGVSTSWIPFVKDLGGLLALLGIVFLFLGRWGWGDRHHDRVIAGGILMVISFLAAIVVAAALTDAVLSAASMPGATPQSVGSTLQSSLTTTIYATVLVGFLAGIGQVLMVYSLADARARLLLIVGFLLGVVIGIVLLAYELPLLNHAIQLATSGSTVDPGPINAFANQLQVIGLITVVPSAITAIAYYLIWRRVDAAVDSTGDLDDPPPTPAGS